MMLYHDTVVLVYAKAPIAGQVNTRLIPDIGVEAATTLQFDLLHQRLSMLASAELCTVQLLCAPNVNHECFISCAEQYPISLFDQVGADLGERMFNGVQAALKLYKYCLVVGTDAPALDETVIKQAIDVLHDGTDVVFVPAEDGGYVLVGMQQSQECLFQKITWGSTEVLQQSTASLDRHKLSYEKLSTLWDIDRLEDYQRYLKQK